MERYEFDVSGPDLARKVSDAWTSITRANDALSPEPPVLLRGDQLVRLSHDEERVKLEPLTQYSLTELLSRTARCTKPTRGGDLVEVEPPVKLAQHLLHRQPGDLPGALRVDRVVDVPVYGWDAEHRATLVEQPGYHADSRTYYAPARALSEEVLFSLDEWRDDPLEKHGHGYTAQAEDTHAAAAFLRHELLGDFPFADEASAAHALCMILEPFARALIPKYEPTPLYAITAHQPRTGKTCLAQSCLAVGCGTVGASAYTPDRDEMRKRLTAVVVEGRPVVWLDNVKDVLDSDALALALTSPQWSDRILGHTQMVDVPIRNMWVMTANNPSISNELTRRCIPIRLDTPHPANYQWRHSLPTWAFENRAKLVRAALVLVGNYVHGEFAGYDEEERELRSRPYVQDVLGTYPGWSRTMGGILRAAGGKEGRFLGNLDAFQSEVDSGGLELAAFIETLAQRLNGREVTRDELAEVVEGFGNPLGAIPLPLELTGGNFKTTAERLGYRLLRPYRGAVIGGYKLVCHEGRPTRWLLERV